MIGKTLKSLLDDRNINVNEFSRMTGISAQTLYSIIKRDNMKIDFEVLLKICRVLNVSVETFYADYLLNNETNLSLTAHERKVIIAYRSHVSEQHTIDKILEVEPEKIETKKQA